MISASPWRLNFLMTKSPNVHKKLNAKAENWYQFGQFDQDEDARRIRWNYYKLHIT